MPKIIDLHSHPSMKPFNNKGHRDEKVTIWDGMEADAENYYALNTFIREVITETARDSQAHLREWVKGELQMSICALHPTERGWFVRSKEKRGKIRKFILQLLLRESAIPSLGAALTGFPISKVKKVIERVEEQIGINYFEEPTIQEYRYLKENQSTVGPWGFTYQLVNDYAEYLQVKSEANKLAIILSLEGGHAITHVAKAHWFDTPYELLTEEDQDIFKTSLTSNIEHLKGRGTNPDLNFDHVPLFITLVHMYNNLLAGHAKSYSGSRWLIRPGMDDLLDQSVGMDTGISDAGLFAIEQLLSRSNGRRILIDVKHLSQTARSQYYSFVQKQRSEGDHIPIIASHAAVSGYEHNDPDRIDTPKLDRNTYLSRWSINLSNEDIRQIHVSDGIIGLVVHEGRMPGGKTKRRLKKLKKCIAKGGRKSFKAQQEMTQIYYELILSNIFQIVLAIGEKSAWDRIAIGSDYDGIMDPFNCYPKAGNFRELINDITNFLEEPRALKLYVTDEIKVFSSAKIKQMMYGLSPAEIALKIASGNAEVFLSKYFTKSYLADGIMPQR